MCGIVGCVSWMKAVLPEQIRAMADAITHRGPDDVGYKVEGGVGFGHRRLSIIDIASGHQPMHTEDGRFWIVFNGEIYNYRELRSELEAKHSFNTSSDTEVLLRLYQEHGAKCVDYLRGMFAFAIYDNLEQELFIARDHLGQKPLFYWHGDDEFVFASEIKCLLAYNPKLRFMNPEALYEYLSIRIITPPYNV